MIVSEQGYDPEALRTFLLLWEIVGSPDQQEQLLKNAWTFDSVQMVWERPRDRRCDMPTIDSMYGVVTAKTVTMHTAAYALAYDMASTSGCYDALNHGE